jgi:radical SAM superfamily enzyme YgiQ (UPF0313 family)
MKDLLLLTSPAPGPQAYGFYLTEKRFPLGLGYIAAIVRQHGYSVDLVDLYAKDRIVDFNQYKYIGIYANTICFEGGTLPLLERIKRAGYKGDIIMGGPHASVMPETIPSSVDYVVQGEGEEEMVSILEGVVHINIKIGPRGGETTELNPRTIKAGRIRNLDDLEFPAYDLYDLSLYNLKFEEGDEYKKVFTYSSSRGCPHQCTFCSSKNIYGRKWTGHSTERIYNDLSRLKGQYGIDGIYFREDNFTANTKRLRRFCNLMIEKPLGLKWKCESRVDISKEDLQLMYDADCRIVYVGFESGSQRILDKIKKNISIEQSKEFVANCKEIGLKVYGSFVTDLPFETRIDKELTERFIKESKLERFSKNKYLALPGSELYNNIIENPAMCERYNTVVIN